MTTKIALLKYQIFTEKNSNNVLLDNNAKSEISYKTHLIQIMKLCNNALLYS